MYNINSHYENIFHYLKSIVTHRRLLYLLPYGSTQPENIETLSDDNSHIPIFVDKDPLFIFYDQEPMYGNFNYQLFDYIQDNFPPPYVLVTTEQHSEPLNLIQERYGWPVVATNWLKDRSLTVSIRRACTPLEPHSPRQSSGQPYCVCVSQNVFFSFSFPQAEPRSFR